MKRLGVLARRIGLLLVSFLFLSLAQADHKAKELWERPLWEGSTVGYLLFFVVTGVCYAAMVWEPKRERIKLVATRRNKRK
jgi:hypothetical protein